MGQRSKTVSASGGRIQRERLESEYEIALQFPRLFSSAKISSFTNVHRLASCHHVMIKTAVSNHKNVCYQGISLAFILAFVRLLCHLTQHQQIATQLTSPSTDCSSSLLLNYRAFAYPDICFCRQKLTLILDIIYGGRLTALLRATEPQLVALANTMHHNCQPQLLWLSCIMDWGFTSGHIMFQGHNPPPHPMQLDKWSNVPDTFLSGKKCLNWICTGLTTELFRRWMIERGRDECVGLLTG